MSYFKYFVPITISSIGIIIWQVTYIKASKIDEKKRIVTRRNFLKALQYHDVSKNISIDDFDELWRKIDIKCVGAVPLERFLQYFNDSHDIFQDLYLSKNNSLNNIKTKRIQLKRVYSKRNLHHAFIDAAKTAATSISEGNYYINNQFINNNTTITNSSPPSTTTNNNNVNESKNRIYRSVQNMGSLVSDTGNLVKTIAVNKKDQVQEKMHQVLMGYIEKSMDDITDKLKLSICDPDMPQCFQDNINIAVDNIMPDIRFEIFRKTEDYFIPKNKVAKKALHKDESQSLEAIHNSLFSYIRGFILYQLYPYDKSIWKCFHNPFWYILNIIGILPIIGQIWWLFLFLLKDKRNEHLLCEFITGFKTAQFVSLGILCTYNGILHYVKCTIQGDLTLCQEGGPEISLWNWSFFVLQNLLIWFSFYRLPYTSRTTESRSQLKTSMNMIISEAKHITKDRFGNIMYLNRGGQLAKLCTYETLLVGIVLFATVFVLSLRFEKWQEKAFLYWIRTAYGLALLPYVFFKIPVLSTFLLHTRKTGYDSYGRTIVSKRRTHEKMA